MHEYTLTEILRPWFILVCLVLPLIWAQGWIHQHFFGIGYLISRDKRSATRLFYVFFLPGIFVHEMVQYLVAGALNVPIKKGIAWPEQQENGTLKMDFIVVDQQHTDLIRATLVAATPFFFMAGLVYYISTQQLDLHDFTASLGSGDLNVIGNAIGDLFNTSDFILWTYLLFAIANTIVPNKADMRGLPLVGGVVAALVTAMIIIGMDAVLIDTLGGPVAEALNMVNSALLTILVLDGMAILMLGILEDTLESFRGFKMDYSGGESLTQPLRRAAREPGSDAPLSKGAPIPSIYSLDLLPLPDPEAAPSRPRPRPAPSAPQPAVSVRETGARPLPTSPPTSAGRTPEPAAVGSRAEAQRPAFSAAASQPAERSTRPSGELPAAGRHPPEAQPSRERSPFQEERPRPFGDRQPVPSGQPASAEHSARPTGELPATGRRPPEAQPSRERSPFQEERPRPFGDRQPVPSGQPASAERSARPAGEFSTADRRLPEAQPSQDRNTFEEERARLFGGRQTAPAERPARPSSEVLPPGERPARPTGSISVRETAPSRERPPVRPAFAAAAQRSDETTTDADDVRYVDFDEQGNLMDGE